jgi:hypothetical protein
MEILKKYIRLKVMTREKAIEDRIRRDGARLLKIIIISAKTMKMMIPARR